MVTSLISAKSFTSMIATASNRPLTEKDSLTELTRFSLAAISFLGDFTRTIAFTVPNPPRPLLVFQLKPHPLFF